MPTSVSSFEKAVFVIRPFSTTNDATIARTWAPVRFLNLRGSGQSNPIAPSSRSPTVGFQTFEHSKQHTLPAVPFHSVIVLCSFRSARKPTNLALTTYELSGPSIIIPDSRESPTSGKKMRSANRANYEAPPWIVCITDSRKTDKHGQANVRFNM